MGKLFCELDSVAMLHKIIRTSTIMSNTKLLLIQKKTQNAESRGEGLGYRRLGQMSVRTRKEQSVCFFPEDAFGDTWFYHETKLDTITNPCLQIGW